MSRRPRSRDRDRGEEPELDPFTGRPLERGSGGGKDDGKGKGKGDKGDKGGGKGKKEPKAPVDRNEKVDYSDYYSGDPLAGISIPAPDKGPRPGDWDCENCGQSVFSYKPACGKCGTPRPRPEPAKSFKCDICKQTKPREEFTKVTQEEMDEMDIPPEQKHIGDIPQADPGRAYVAVIMRKNAERGFGFAKHQGLNAKYQKDILIQKTDMEKIEAQVGPSKIMGARVQFALDIKDNQLQMGHSGQSFTAFGALLYQVMCKPCMETTLPVLLNKQMECEEEGWKGDSRTEQPKPVTRK